MKTKPEADGKNPTDAFKPEEPTFRYSLELVATIAAHFVDGNTNETAASERAIKLLDAVNETIRRKTIILRARTKAERLSKETPKHLPFAKGIRRITDQRTETEAIKPFRDYLRLNIRLSDLGHPSQLSDEQVKALFSPLPDGAAKEAEEALIQQILARYRENGFNQRDLISIKEAWERLRSGLVRSFQNSEKGKIPPRQGKWRGRPSVAQNNSKKSLERKIARRK